MSARASGASPASPPSGELYSPLRRTALLLTGIGTAGAYHAGVLRALHEAGVKIDVVAGRGVGVVGALFAAVDGAGRLWDEKGFWRARAVHHFYGWRPVFAVCLWSVVIAASIVVVPLAVSAAGLIVLPVAFVLSLTGISALSGLADAYLGLLRGWFAQDALPTWLPRLALLTLGAGLGVAAVSAWLQASRRRQRGPFWWRLIPAPLTASTVSAHCWATLWDLLRGAAPLKQPTPSELASRYTEVLADNLGQPGFRELLIAVHDLDAGRDLLFALVNETRRQGMVRRPTTREAEDRRADIVDLAGVSRHHLADAVSASLTVALATEPHAIQFAADAYWRGETHRLCDRPGSAIRLIDELAALGVEQVVVVSAAPEMQGPHALTPARLDGRGRLSEYLQSTESALVRDVAHQTRAGGPQVFTIRPLHNPVGPLDFVGGFDDRSDRRLTIVELMSRGYEDAYHQFVEPVLGASGERVGDAVEPHLTKHSRTRA